MTMKKIRGILNFSLSKFPINPRKANVIKTFNVVFISKLQSIILPISGNSTIVTN